MIYPNIHKASNIIIVTVQESLVSSPSRPRAPVEAVWVSRFDPCPAWRPQTHAAARDPSGEAGENHGRTMGEPWENGGLMGFNGIIWIGLDSIIHFYNWIL